MCLSHYLLVQIGFLHFLFPGKKENGSKRKSLCMREPDSLGFAQESPARA
jgi:hypothetical protein